MLKWVDKQDYYHLNEKFHGFIKLERISSETVHIFTILTQLDVVHFSLSNTVNYQLNTICLNRNNEYTYVVFDKRYVKYLCVTSI